MQATHYLHLNTLHTIYVISFHYAKGPFELQLFSKNVLTTPLNMLTSTCVRTQSLILVNKKEVFV